MFRIEPNAEALNNFPLLPAASNRNEKCEMNVQRHLSKLPPDYNVISAAKLNIEDKARSNLFPWNGQFSPQFVEAMLTCYARENAMILDPFCGSGTVLAEASRLGVAATGIELNPAAFILARTYSLSNVSLSRRVELLDSVEHKLQTILPKGWPLLMAVDAGSPDNFQVELTRLHAETALHERHILESFIILADFFKGVNAPRLSKTWSKLRQTIEQLPVSRKPIETHHADSRYLRSGKLFDLVLTSPPYINVYNYHQQYRTSAEALGWNLLHVAKTEIGSNRKNRGNRFLTVTQYCLDLAICLNSLWSATAKEARIIFVMGRESRVRGVPFFNGEIAACLAIESVGYRLALRQERVFTNRFGQRIYEDILHFLKPPVAKPNQDHMDRARIIADTTLRAALKCAEADAVKDDLLDAIDKISGVGASPRYVSQFPNAA